METNFGVKDILRLEVAPALGCTEPVAVALATASAASLLPSRLDIDAIEVWVDPNTYKNGMAVVIPGTDGMIGLECAAAVGAFGGDPNLGLEVLKTLGEESLDLARQLLAGNVITTHLYQETGLHVSAVVTSGENTACSEIKDAHTNIIELTLNDEPVSSEMLLGRPASPTGQSPLAELEDWLVSLSLSDIYDMVDDLDDEDLAFLRLGVDYNLALAQHGLKYGSGLGIGKAIDRLVKQKLLVKDIAASARLLTSAAADARMSGVNLPAMSSAGSGNHGLTAILPIWACKDFIDTDEQTLLKAIGLSHIITAYVKAHTGRLSAVCGCAVAAGAGATAGITYLVGGNVEHMAGAIKNILEDLAGVICDGAKAGCALKLNTAAGAAVQAALFSLQGVNVKDTDGIIGASTEQTVQNLGTLSHKGMVETDRIIIEIMRDKLEKKKSSQ
jgi:L-cysteine desulfidase